MFSLHYQEDGTYKADMPDNSHVVLPKGVEDTKALRRELAKLSHRIATQEHIYTDKRYIQHWPTKLAYGILTSEQVEQLKELYSEVMWNNEEWSILDTYEDPSHEQIALLAHDLVIQNSLLTFSSNIQELTHEKSPEKN